MSTRRRMMFCEKCGVENSESARFCKGCGQPLDNDVDSVKSANRADRSGLNEGLSKQKTLPKGILLGACAVVVALVFIVFLVVGSGSTINLNDYLSIEVSGHDGYGYATLSIDWDAIEEKYGDKISFTKNANKEFGGFLNFMTPVEVLREYVDIDITATSGLSNGDTISYTFDVDEDLSNLLDCNVKYSGGTFTVSGLDEVQTFDAFADVQISFSGVSPYGKLEFEYVGEYLSVYDFSFDQTHELKNGDVVTVTICISNIASFIERHGCAPMSLEKEYTVSGLPEYAQTYAALPEQFKETVKAEAVDTITTYVTDKYDESSYIENLRYAGYIMLIVKEDAFVKNTHNDLFVIYSAAVSSSRGNFDTTTVYFPVRFTDISVCDGNASYADNSGISGHSSLGGGYGTDGYANPVVCYVELVEENQHLYVSECGDGFELYADYDSVMNLGDISDAYKEVLYADAKAQVEELFRSFPNGTEVNEFRLAGEIFLVAKSQSTELADNNKYCIVLSAVISNSDRQLDPTTIYYPLEYDGIVQLADGSYVCTQSHSVSGYWYMPIGITYYKGYANGERLFNDFISARSNKYTYEITGDISELEGQ